MRLVLLRWRVTGLLTCLALVPLAAAACSPTSTGAASYGGEEGHNGVAGSAGGMLDLAVRFPPDRATVARLVPGSLQVTSPGRFVAADVRDAYRDCASGLGGALAWLTGAETLVGEEVSTDATEPGEVAGTIGVVATLARSSEDPIELSLAGRHRCGRSAHEVDVSIDGLAERFVWMDLGPEGQLEGWLAVRTSDDKVAVMLVATVADANSRPTVGGGPRLPGFAASRVLAAGLPEAERVLDELSATNGGPPYSGRPAVPG